MSECLKIYEDLDIVGKKLDVKLLKHLSEKLAGSSKLVNALKSHMKLHDMEVTDFRSAIHLLNDWFYGWNVTDDSYSPSHGQSVKRVPRDINLTEESECIEAEKIRKVFHTLFNINLRNLKKMATESDNLVELTIADENKFKNVDNPKAISRPVSAKDTKKAESLNTSRKVVKNGQDKNLFTVQEESPDSKKQEEGSDTLAPTVQPTMRQAMNKGRRASTRRLSIIGSIQYNIPDASQGAFVKKGGFHRRASVAPADEVIAAEKPPTPEIQEYFYDGLYGNLERQTDYSILTISNGIVVLALAEILNDESGYSKILNFMHEIATDFVMHTFRNLYVSLIEQFPDMSITLHDLREKQSFRTLLRKLFPSNERKDREIGRPSKANATDTSKDDETITNCRTKVTRIYQKFQFIGSILSALDIYLFPLSLLGHQGGVRVIRYSSFSSIFFLTAGNDCVLRIHDSTTQTILSEYYGHRSIISDAHFTRNDSHIISSSFDRTIKIWASQSAECERVLLGHEDGVTSCHVSPDSRFVVSGGMDCAVKVWDFATGECLATILKHTKWVKVVRFSHDGHFIATAGLDKKIYIWDMKIILHGVGTITHNRCIDAHHDYVLDLAFFRPSLLLTTSRDQTVRLFDYMSGREQLSISISPSWACSVSFSEDGNLFVAGSCDNNIHIFRTKTGEKLRQLRVFNLGIHCVGFPDHNKYILCGTTEGVVQKITL